jgi:hypothetical protein
MGGGFGNKLFRSCLNRVHFQQSGSLLSERMSTSVDLQAKRAKRAARAFESPSCHRVVDSPDKHALRSRPRLIIQKRTSCRSREAAFGNDLESAAPDALNPLCRGRNKFSIKSLSNRVASAPQRRVLSFLTMWTPTVEPARWLNHERHCHKKDAGR